jgi:hypothetical protein
MISKLKNNDAKHFLNEFVGETKSENKHYKTNSIDVIDFCKFYDLNFNEGNVIKYVARAKKKGSHIQDLYKAIDYLQRELKFLENGKK